MNPRRPLTRLVQLRSRRIAEMGSMRCITGEAAGAVVGSIAADGVAEVGSAATEVEKVGIVVVEGSGVIVEGRAGTGAVGEVGSEDNAAVAKALSDPVRDGGLLFQVGREPCGCSFACRSTRPLSTFRSFLLVYLISGA